MEQHFTDDPEIQVCDRYLAADATVSTVGSVTHHYASARPPDADWDAFIDELVRLSRWVSALRQPGAMTAENGSSLTGFRLRLCPL